MGFEDCVSGVLGGIRKLPVTVAAAFILCGLFAANGLAGGVSANSGDTLEVTGATAGVLPQASGPSGENGLLSGLYISGYASQLFGMW